MLQMNLLSNRDGIVRYSYQPEKSGELGILEYDIRADELHVDKKAEKDGASAFYREQAIKMIRENINKLPQEILLSWY